MTTSEKYWNSYTIADVDKNNVNFTNEYNKSINHFKTIDRLYPLYCSLFDLYTDHKDEIIVDYGCGPANDVLGFALFSKCKKIIGIDVSNKALSIARNRLKLHNLNVTDDATDGKGITFLKVTEDNNKINIRDNYIDYIQSTGVLHHTTKPVEILKELYRILKPGGKLKIMMYHRNCIYVRLILVLELLKKNMDVDVYYYFEKMGRADSGAPIAFLSDKDDFLLMGKKANFDCKFINAAFSIADLRGCLDIPHALCNNKFPEKHKKFLRDITYYTVEEIEMNDYKNIKLEIDRLYEIEITIITHYSQDITFDGLTDKGYYENPTNYIFFKSHINKVYESITIKKKLYSFKDVLNINGINNNFNNYNIKITQIYPSFNGYNPGMNAIYEFAKPNN